MSFFLFLFLFSPFLSFFICYIFLSVFLWLSFCCSACPSALCLPDKSGIEVKCVTLRGLYFFNAWVKFPPNILLFASTDGQIHSQNQAGFFLLVYCYRLTQVLTYPKPKFRFVFSQVLEVCVRRTWGGGWWGDGKHICSVHINIQLQHLLLYRWSTQA